MDLARELRFVAATRRTLYVAIFLQPDKAFPHWLACSFRGAAWFEGRPSS